MINLITEKIYYDMVGTEKPKYQTIKLQTLPEGVDPKDEIILYCRYFDQPFVIFPNLHRILVPETDIHGVIKLVDIIRNSKLDYSDWIITYESPKIDEYLLDVYTKYHRLGSIHSLSGFKKLKQGKYILKNSYLSNISMNFSLYIVPSDYGNGNDIYMAFPEKADEMESNSIVSGLQEFYTDILIHNNGRIINGDSKKSK